MILNNRIFIVCSLACLLAGCQPEPENKIVEFIQKTKNEKMPYQAVLPNFPKPTRFQYAASDFRNPFEAIFIPKSADNTETPTGPDLKRVREALEAYPLDSLSMVGTLERQGIFYVLLKDKTGSIHRANVGSYIGQNSGQIEKINDEETEIKEWLEDGKGGWREHRVTIPLVHLKEKQQGV